MVFKQVRDRWKPRPRNTDRRTRPTFRPRVEVLEDRTVLSTTLVKDIVVGQQSSNPLYLTNVNGTLYFRVGADLWKSNGTANGTVLVRANITPLNLTAVGAT